MQLQDAWGAQVLGFDETGAGGRGEGGGAGREGQGRGFMHSSRLFETYIRL